MWMLLLLGCWRMGGGSRQSGRLSESGRVQTKEKRIDQCGPISTPEFVHCLLISHRLLFTLGYDNKRCVCTRGVM